MIIMIDRVTFVLLYALNDQLCEQVLCYQRLFFLTNKTTRLSITEFAAGHRSMRDKPIQSRISVSCSRVYFPKAVLSSFRQTFALKWEPLHRGGINGREVGANIRVLITILNYRSDCLHAGAILFNVVRSRAACLVRRTYLLSSYLVSTVLCVNTIVGIKFIVLRSFRLTDSLG